MSLDFIGFVVALVSAVLVLIWIAYCMFIRERHKSEFYHHNITDLQRRNDILDMKVEEVPTKKEVTVGFFALPSRHKQKDEGYDGRPDYPEAFPHDFTHSSTDLIDDVDGGGGCGGDGNGD